MVLTCFNMASMSVSSSQGFHIEEDGGLGNHFGFLGLLLVVSLQPLLSNSLLLLIIRLLIRPEEVHIIIVILLLGRGTASTHIGRGVLAGLGELVHAGSEGLDVVVPSQRVRSLGFRSSGQSLEDGGVRLAGYKPLDIAVFG